MRLVVDTNVFISAALKDSSWPAHTIRWLSKMTVSSRAPQSKTSSSRCCGGRVSPTRSHLSFFSRKCSEFRAAEQVAISERIALCRDPEDDKFIELAVNGRADLIISGDADLLGLDSVRDIPIVTPAAFVRAGIRT